ncbi:uncharacterized protein BDR25DRAFT_363101 [Lindgomyces ingoldianus]|uniref:Uncharacterized protein n=1 Tax=Lindgomyces ingoldianus TaxID=673940 RepID=A0ACB6Q8J7_9PLEO|nr:uncharacterized protein BDR25DRAFT_363101 [Lindgomyces ingoldianus]KAF2463200.1 hypothetical protein BDR25DRAFT_363101 [Lindgomyces ingoldianus]
MADMERNECYFILLESLGRSALFLRAQVLTVRFELCRENCILKIVEAYAPEIAPEIAPRFWNNTNWIDFIAANKPPLPYLKQQKKEEDGVRRGSNSGPPASKIIREIRNQKLYTGANEILGKQERMGMGGQYNGFKHNTSTAPPTLNGDTNACQETAMIRARRRGKHQGTRFQRPNQVVICFLKMLSEQGLDNRRAKVTDESTFATPLGSEYIPLAGKALEAAVCPPQRHAFPIASLRIPQRVERVQTLISFVEEQLSGLSRGILCKRLRPFSFPLKWVCLSEMLTVESSATAKRTDDVTLTQTPHSPLLLVENSAEYLAGMGVKRLGSLGWKDAGSWALVRVQGGLTSDELFPAIQSITKTAQRSRRTSFSALESSSVVFKLGAIKVLENLEPCTPLTGSSQPFAAIYPGFHDQHDNCMEEELTNGLGHRCKTMHLGTCN